MLSRLSKSFKSLNGVLVDMEIPDKAAVGVWGPGKSLGSFTNISFGAIFRL